MAGRADFDIYNVLLGLGRIREQGQVMEAMLNPRFLMRLRRTLLPLPIIDRKREAYDVATLFPAFRSEPIKALQGKRIGMIAGGGSGGCVSLIGVKRAFEEAGIEPAMISSCSGGTLWGSMWAAGLSAEEMAEFSLGWEIEDYLDIQWHKIPGFVASAFKGFTGVAKGAAIQRTFDDRFGNLTVGELPIPLTSIVYDMDRGGVEYFGPETHPELTVGQLVRIAIALPLVMEAVRVNGHLYVDGGVVDLLPSRPLHDDGKIDHAIAVNVMLPPQLQPADLTGWEDRLMGILDAARQAEQGFHVESGRRTRADFEGRFTMIDAADHALLRGPSFFDLFLDRSRWPALIQNGYEQAKLELAKLDAKPTRAAAPKRARAASTAAPKRARAASTAASKTAVKTTSTKTAIKTMASKTAVKTTSTKPAAKAAPTPRAKKPATRSAAG
ncbi:MAG: patatin-like phospholipase family protein [Solirubrobacteraceae bacterium]|nr:patatin-like phospholipase family protein [Solirubrobacteraceae bacterium]